MFAQNFTFLLFFATVLSGGILVCLNAHLSTLTQSLRLAFYFVIPLTVFSAIYGANLLLILTLAGQQLQSRTEALWKERLLAALERRAPTHSSKDLLDHAAWVQFQFHRATYRLGLWELEERR